jgi:hypothetical protein
MFLLEVVPKTQLFSRGKDVQLLRFGLNVARWRGTRDSTFPEARSITLKFRKEELNELKISKDLLSKLEQSD